MLEVHRSNRAARSHDQPPDMTNPDTKLEHLLADLRTADGDEAIAQLGNQTLSSLLLHHPSLVDKVLKIARRDNRMRNCLSAARYYTGLSAATCAKIDAVLQAPFPAAAQPRRKPSRR